MNEATDDLVDIPSGTDKPKPRKATKDSTASSRAVRDTKDYRHNMRMYKDDYEKLVYWAEQYGMDRTDFLITAMNHYIRYRNQDYDLPTAEIQRLNQMVDAVKSLASNQAHLEKTVINGFDAMLGIIRGDNYLVEKEDGEL